MKRRNRRWWAATVVSALALAAVLPAQAVDEGACGCWYAGYDDGFEYAWQERREAEGYKACARRGQARHYEDGMKKAAERARRQCPVGK